MLVIGSLVFLMIGAIAFTRLYDRRRRQQLAALSQRIMQNRADGKASMLNLAGYDDRLNWDELA